MQYLAAALLMTIALPAPAQDLRLPFDGRWFVVQAGDTLNVNQHMGVAAQAFGIDFAKVAGAGQRQLAPGTPTRVEDYFSWGEAVLSPSDGTVVSVVDDRPDNPLATKDIEHPAGNHLAIRVADGRFVFLAHMQRGSITVKAGEAVKRGQQLGRCGNSGNTDFPHIHLHVQDTPRLNVGRGQNPVFAAINVELTGKQFTGVTWPLIRGLFVWNP